MVTAQTKAIRPIWQHSAPASFIHEVRETSQWPVDEARIPTGYSIKSIMIENNRVKIRYGK
jgi:hypothetical protein